LSDAEYRELLDLPKEETEGSADDAGSDAGADASADEVQK
jgi:hypothetical protein